MDEEEDGRDAAEEVREDADAVETTGGSVAADAETVGKRLREADFFGVDVTTLLVEVEGDDVTDWPR